MGPSRTSDQELSRLLKRLVFASNRIEAEILELEIKASELRFDTSDHSQKVQRLSVQKNKLSDITKKLKHIEENPCQNFFCCLLERMKFARIKSDAEKIIDKKA
ncbi:MAG: hypothetical protein F6K11_20210 [Leptolyngbya sp. SIO3F4]|nr:hypothetical protein [Leptolyngbya sp. SIO3F4]